jgi:hypothetical protein
MPDLDGPFRLLEPVGRIGIRKKVSGYAQQDELRGIVRVLVQPGLQFTRCNALPISCQKPVTYPIEKQDR